MNCKQCGAALQPTDRFCSICGTAVANGTDVWERQMKRVSGSAASGATSGRNAPVGRGNAPTAAAKKQTTPTTNKSKSNTTLLIILLSLLATILVVAGVILLLYIQDNGSTSSGGMTQTVTAQLPVTEPEATELADYLGRTADDLENLLGMSMHSHGTGEGEFDNGALAVSFCELQTLHRIEVTQTSYALGGVYLGMDKEQALRQLSVSGYTTGWDFGSNFEERSDGEKYIHISFTDVVTELYIAEYASYGDGYCYACRWFEEEEVIEEPMEEETTVSADPKDREYLLPYSDVRLVTEAELAELTHEELCFARNEIYARHGRQFNHEVIRAYFESKDWYHGTISPGAFNVNVFNSIEKENIKIIENYEARFGGSYY